MMTKASVKPALRRIEDKIDQLMKTHEVQEDTDNPIDPTRNLELKCERDPVEQESLDQDNQSENGENPDGE